MEKLKGYGSKREGPKVRMEGGTFPVTGRGMLKLADLPRTWRVSKKESCPAPGEVLPGNRKRMLFPNPCS